MRKRMPAMAGALALIGCAALAVAQTPPAPPKPGPEVKKLGAFVGKWTSEGEMKPGPMGPGGKVTGTDSCEWISGGFGVMCRENGSMPGAAKMVAMGMMGYDSESKMYTYHEVDSMGEVVTSQGKVDGDTWTWESDSKVNGQTMHTKYTMKFTSKDAHDYKFEMGPNENSMSVIMEGTEKRAMTMPPSPPKKN